MLKLRLFGGFELTGGNGPPLRSRKAQALLAYLAVPAGQPQERDKLAALLWGDRSDVQARRSLAQTLYVIRKSLGPLHRRTVIVDNRVISLDPARIEIDVARFESLIADQTPESTGEAAALYHDELLAGFRLSEFPFQEWLRGEQQRLLDRLITTLKTRLRHQFAGSNNAAAIETAGRLLLLDPLQESVHRTLMRLHQRASQKAAAIRQYQACATILRRELNIEPDQATETLYREIADDRSAVATIPHGQESDTAWPYPSCASGPPFPAENVQGCNVNSFLCIIDLGKTFKPIDTRLNSARTEDTCWNWTLGSGVPLASGAPVKFTATFRASFSAIVADVLSVSGRLLDQARRKATERRSTYYRKTVIDPPSMTRSSCDPAWSVIVSVLVHR